MTLCIIANKLKEFKNESLIESVFTSLYVFIFRFFKIIRLPGGTAELSQNQCRNIKIMTKRLLNYFYADK